MEQSRSPTIHTVPCVSAMTWTSMCRAVGRYGSTNTVSSPKAESASAPAAASSPSRAAGSVTTRIPRPPPPADAFTSSGKSAAVAESGSTDRIGTPAFAISSLARIFDPIASMVSGAGPIQMRPASCTRRANSAFSDKNP